MNNLYLLKRTDEGSWDEACGFVVRACSHTEARRLASDQHGDEGHEVWLHRQHSTCQQLRPGGKPGVILRDFRNG